MDNPDDDNPITLKEACDTIFKGAISPATLRAEAQRGRLVIERIGRRDFVTRAGIRAMRKLCEVRPEAIADKPYTNDHWTDEQRKKAAIAAARATAEELRRMARKK